MYYIGSDSIVIRLLKNDAKNKFFFTHPFLYSTWSILFFVIQNKLTWIDYEKERFGLFQKAIV